MKLRLKEEPKEWLKFTAVLALAVAIIAFLLFRRHLISGVALVEIAGALAVVLLICGACPRWFRGLYRAGLTASWHVGQGMGRVLLTVFFLVVVTPLGILLRLLGKDLLALKRDPAAKTYWKTTKPGGPYNQQF